MPIKKTSKAPAKSQAEVAGIPPFLQEKFIFYVKQFSKAQLVWFYGEISKALKNKA